MHCMRSLPFKSSEIFVPLKSLTMLRTETVDTIAFGCNSYIIVLENNITCCIIHSCGQVNRNRKHFYLEFQKKITQHAFTLDWLVTGRQTPRTLIHHVSRTLCSGHVTRQMEYSCLTSIKLHWSENWIAYVEQILKKISEPFFIKIHVQSKRLILYTLSYH